MHSRYIHLVWVHLIQHFFVVLLRKTSKPRPWVHPSFALKFKAPPHEALRLVLRSYFESYVQNGRN